METIILIALGICIALFSYSVGKRKGLAFGYQSGIEYCSLKIKEAAKWTPEEKKAKLIEYCKYKGIDPDQFMKENNITIDEE